MLHVNAKNYGVCAKRFFYIEVEVMRKVAPPVPPFIFDPPVKMNIASGFGNSSESPQTVVTSNLWLIRSFLLVIKPVDLSIVEEANQISNAPSSKK